MLPVYIAASTFLQFFDNSFNDLAGLLDLQRLLDDHFILHLDFECLLEYLLRDLIVLSHSLQFLLNLLGRIFLQLVDSLYLQ